MIQPEGPTTRDCSCFFLYLSAAASLAVIAAARWFGPAYFYVTEREWQTALTTLWTTLEGRGLFDAPTPLMGPPWHIPIEFPLFQWLAAQVDVPVLSLGDTGRLLSLIFFLTGVAVFRKLALDLDLDRRVANTSTALVVTSPLFLAYAFSYTIENLAILLGLISLWALVRWLRQPNLTLLILATLAGCAGALAKATTWAIFAAVMIVLAFWVVTAARRHGRSAWDTTVGTSLAILIPLACGLAWVHWSDAVKVAQPLASDLTSASLSQWNYGTFEQKIALSQWGAFILRSTALVLGPLGLLAVGPAVVSAFRSHRQRPPFPVLLASAIGLVAGPLIFTNLFFQHDYYALTPGLFAVLLFSSVFFSRRSRPWLLSLLILSNLVTAAAFLAD
ncbi:MAG: glycosyltransferase family 39 protein, partial [Thermoanaerobaculales bacterium]|nr:glycosyltransferase family 39 protein [Thermoanaerobaculales bacterium]